jgi:lipase ATG15
MLKNLFNGILTFEFIYDLAAMSFNTYNPITSSVPNTCTTKWIDVSLNNVRDISIMNDSLRAYLFSNENYTENVIAIKGTTMYWGLVYAENKTETDDQHIYSSAYNDKYNDNLFFSCCYHKQSSLFEACDKCDQTKNDKVCCKDCYNDTMTFELNYFTIGINIVENVKQTIDFNNENVSITFTGHSLGGAVASYLGLYYDKVAVAFEAPGDKHYADLIGLTNSGKINKIYQAMKEESLDADTLLMKSGLNAKDFGDQIERFKFILKKI